jgi:hypothetical protein
MNDKSVEVQSLFVHVVIMESEKLRKSCPDSLVSICAFNDITLRVALV